jgi:hypothetical protein
MTARFSTSPRHSHRLLGLPSLLSKQRLPNALYAGQSDRDVNLITDLQLVSRSRIHGSIHPLPVHPHGVMLN